MIRLRYFIALLAMSLSTAYGENITFKSRKWDSANQKVLTEEVTEDCIAIEGQNDEWQGLGEKGKTYYYVVRGTVKRKTLNCFGEVHIVLCDDASLTCTGGIKLEKHNAAQIHIHTQSDGDAMGCLTVTNSYKETAGIGSAEDVSCGDVFIHGGKLDVTGGEYGAGIGTGPLYDREGSVGGEVRVYAGDVTVHGGYKAAGIGSGSAWNKAENDAGELYVYGGTVRATGGEMGAGVGGGGGRDRAFIRSSKMGSDGGKVYVYGGKLIATGGRRAAGIGSGSSYPGAERSGGLLRVFGGVVEATGGDYGAGIGGGCNCTGGDVEISGGTVRATGGKNSAGIGGGEDGKPGQCKINGGTVTAIIGENCNGRAAGEGSAIGNGKGESKDYAADVLTIADNMMVRAGDSETNIERTFTTPERTAACQWRSVAIIEACTHVGATYVIIDGEKHRRNCIYCAANQDEAHDFGETGNHHDCACGQKFDSETTVLAVTRYYYTYDSTTNTAGTGSATDKVARSQKYILPAPPAIDGLIFKGYSTDQETGHMFDSEVGNLTAAGEVGLTDNTTYYARYIYDLKPEWTWNDDCTSASVKLTNDILVGDETITVTPELLEDQKPSGNQLGRKTYKATATYTYEQKVGDNTYPFTYTFTDEQVVEYWETTYFTLNALADDNEEIIDELVKKYSEEPITVVIENMILVKDGKLHPLCLPFSVSIEDSPLEDATIYSAEEADVAIVNGQLQMTFKPITGKYIKAGMPYFVKWPQGNNIVNPTFDNVVMDDDSYAMNDDNGFYEFGGVFDKLSIEDDGVMLTLDDDEFSYLANNVTGTFTNYLHIPFKKTEGGDIAVSSVQFSFSDDDDTVVTVEKNLYEGWEGEGTEESPYIILTAGQLQEMSITFNNDAASLEGKYFRQDANIVFDRSKENNYIPAKKFTGHYDGGGHTISGLNVNTSGTSGVSQAALFVTLDCNATVKNVIIRNSTFQGTNAAGIAASIYDNQATVENCHLLKDVSIVAVRSTDGAGGSAGGIVGWINSGGAQVQGCTSHASVDGYLGVGGIVGQVTAGSVSQCISLGNSVSGYRDFYAVAFRFRPASAFVNDCYYTSSALSDGNATLMPAESQNSTDFLTRLSTRDQFLQEVSGLTASQIGYDITLNGRTLYKDGSWNTLCLPFAMDATQIAASSLAGATIKELNASESGLATNGTLTLKFTTAYDPTDAPTGSIVAGKAYIVKWTTTGDDITNPTFPGVIISSTAPTAVEFDIAGSTDKCQFVGQYSPFSIGDTSNGTYDGDLNEIIMLGANNQLGYSQNARTLRCFRAHFLVPANSATGQQQARSFVMDFGDGSTATGILTVTADTPKATAVGTFTLDGRRISGQPTQKGVYVVNGKKMVVK